MNHALKALTLLTLVSASAQAADTVALELPKFLGTWYELARYDEYFERGCAGVTSQYTMLNESELRVVNRCRKGGLDGELKTIEGKSWVADAKEPGKLKLQFVWPFSADFWVLDMASDASWTLVGNSKKSSCWIFSRTPTISPELWSDLAGRLTARGYDVKKLIRVEQKPPAAEATTK